MQDNQHKPYLTTSIINDIENFLHIAIEGPVPSTVQLIRALDKLGAAYHEGTSVQFVNDNVEPTASNYSELYNKLGKRFPELGLYAIRDPLNLTTNEELMGDAIDDLADIVGDLQKVIWRSNHVDAENAIWHFCNLYAIHWGRHLRELSLYLHAKQFYGD